MVTVKVRRGKKHMNYQRDLGADRDRVCNVYKSLYTIVYNVYNRKAGDMYSSKYKKTSGKVTITIRGPA